MKTVFNDVSQSELFQKVGDICAVVNTATNSTDLFEISLKKTVSLFGAKRGSIFILKENGKDLILGIAQGMKNNEERQMVKRMGEGIVGRVAQSKKPIFVYDIANDKRFRNYKGRKSYSTPSFICAPLMIKDVLIGVINISDKECGSYFNEDELQLLDFLTSQIALNYRRIQLYRKFKSLVKERQSLENKLGETDEETKDLKRKIVIQEKLATIGKLAGGIAHEFNNPLDGVMRYTNLCLTHIKDDDVVRGYLLEVKQGLNRMANIVKNLLACSRSSYPVAEYTEFTQALEYSLAGKQAELKRQKITLKKKIDKNIPRIRDLGLERILTNLLRNAMDAIEDKGTITIKAKYRDHQLVISFSDTGSGIDAKMLEKVFEPFYTTKDIEKGCGLGLTIVGEIVKSYNGTIKLESKPGKGTTFDIVLPVG